MNEVLKVLKERRSCRSYRPEQITDEELNAVLEAGTYAPTARGQQSPIIVAVQNPAVVEQLRKMNAAVLGTPEADPFYGAPTVLVVLVVILALLLVGVRLVGLRPMCVLSGSMEPTYHTGSLIYVKPCAPEDVQVGDAITFVLNEDLDVVTHRVISIDAENEHFYTQGDANDAPDGAPVYFKNLIGRPVFTIPYLGFVSHWVSNPPGMYLPDMLRKAAEADARDAARRAEAANAAKCTEKDDKNRKI